MAYNNLENRVTSVEIAQFTNGTGAGQGLSYSTISLTSGVPHVDQLEVERIFDIDFSVNGFNVQDNISTYDLHRIFLLQKSEYTLNETTSKLTNISITPSRAYTIVKAKNANLPAGTQITIPSFISGSEKVIVRRKTLSFDPYVSWTAGTRLTSDQLNFQVQQLLRLNQELIYKLESEYLRVNDISGASAPAFDVANSLDMGNNKIINLATPLASTDAANKGYIDTALANYVTLAGTQSITGAKTFTSSVILSSTLAVTGNTTVGGTLSVTGGLGISGSSPLSNTVNIGTDGNGKAYLAAGGTNCIIMDRDAGDPRVTIPNSGSLSVTGSITATGGVVGNASTATALQTARTINDVSFDGTSNITVTAIAAANTLTGTALASSVVTSSLTSVGTLNNLTTSGTTTVPNVKISGTASADVNTLDYYEEGTWTPTLVGSTVSNGTITGRYTRIGNTVTIAFFLTGVTISGTPTAEVSGLPFASGSRCIAPVYHANAFGFGYILAYTTSGSSSIRFSNVQTATATDVSPTTGSNKGIQFSLTYFI
jgi:hypothetical protein